MSSKSQRKWYKYLFNEFFAQKKTFLRGFSSFFRLKSVRSELISSFPWKTLNYVKKWCNRYLSSFYANYWIFYDFLNIETKAFSELLKNLNKKYGVFAAANFAAGNLTAENFASWNFRRVEFRHKKLRRRKFRYIFLSSPISPPEISSPEFSPYYISSAIFLAVL